MTKSSELCDECLTMHYFPNRTPGHLVTPGTTQAGALGRDLLCLQCNAAWVRALGLTTLVE